MVKAKRRFQRYEYITYRKKGLFIITLIFCCLVGFLFSYFARMLFMRGAITTKSCFRARILNQSDSFQTDGLRNNKLENLTEAMRSSKRFVLVSVMTAHRFLVSRAESIHATWGETIPSGMIAYFTGEEGNTSVKFHINKLPGVTDSYPPQRKSFYMLKYLYDHYIDNFHWFVRADDDVYINIERLSQFLRGFDSSEDVVIGHSGVGKPHEMGKLGLQEDNFCLGGPGVVMSHSLLRKLGPHLVTCLNETVTAHEDTELSRCIRRYVGVMCPWAQQTRNIFHQIYESENIDTVLSGGLDKKGIRSAITVHPVKNSKHMSRLHYIFLSQVVQRLTHKAAQLHKNRDRINRLLSENNNNDFSNAYFFGRLPRNSSTHWESFQTDKIYTLGGSTVEWVSGRTLQTMKDVKRNALRFINTEAAKRLEPPEELKKLYFGVMRTYVTQGLQFLLELNTILKSSVPNRIEKINYRDHYVQLQQSFAPLVSRIIETATMAQVIQFIVPLAGRFQTFQRFLDSFERAFIIPKKQVALLIVYFPEVSDPRKHKELYEAFCAKYPNFVLTWLELAGEFNRARALELGSKCCGDDALLFFSDVDFIFSTEFFDRCRTNALPGKRVYFPIFFSQYNPEVAYHNQTRPPWDDRAYTKRAGTWRKYSFGPVCIYAGDVKAVGGLNTSIRGWGLEDLDFLSKCLEYQIEVFRVPELGLLHIYHQQTNCRDRRLNADQAKMCTDSRLNGVASVESLVNYLHSKRYV